MKDHASHKLSPEKRARLFLLASREFAAQGFERASLNQIISEIGMSKSSFYHYFENKADLFQQTLEHTLAPLLDGFGAFDFEALDAGSFWPALRAMAYDNTLSAARAPGMELVGRMVLRAMEDPNERALTRDLIAFINRWQAALIRRGQQLGLVRDDLPDDLLVELLMGVTMAFDRWTIEHWDRLSEMEKADMTDRALNLYMRVLQPEPAPG